MRAAGTPSDESTRANFVKQSTAFVTASIAALAATPVQAAVAGGAEAQQVDWTTEFSQIKETYGAFLPELEKNVGSENWAELQELTKGLDMTFRKKLLGGLRKRMPKGKVQDLALSSSNSVTFDLIALNKAARTKNKSEADQALASLKEDVGAYLALEKTVSQVLLQ